MIKPTKVILTEVPSQVEYKGRVLQEIELIHLGITCPKAIRADFKRPTSEELKVHKANFKELKKAPKRYQEALNEVLIAFMKSQAPRWGALKLYIRTNSQIVKMNIPDEN